MNNTERKPITIYPAYINSNRTKNGGRRLPKKKCVPDPKWQEMKDVLEAVKLNVIPEPNKVYCRELDKETPAFRGRVRVFLPENDTKFRNKDDVLEYLVDTIPKLKTRGKQPASTSAPVAPETSSKKKDKKRR